ncbi:MAG: hypothetical protein HY554_06470 [Elusimicrobia bacterium]|nr:hypothetical protein [Elusimicrobiota bacterium]
MTKNMAAARRTASRLLLLSLALGSPAWLSAGQGAAPRKPTSGLWARLMGDDVPPPPLSAGCHSGKRYSVSCARRYWKEHPEDPLPVERIGGRDYSHLQRARAQARAESAYRRGEGRQPDGPAEPDGDGKPELPFDGRAMMDAACARRIGSSLACFIGGAKAMAGTPIEGIGKACESLSASQARDCFIRAFQARVPIPLDYRDASRLILGMCGAIGGPYADLETRDCFVDAAQQAGGPFRMILDGCRAGGGLAPCFSRALGQGEPGAAEASISKSDPLERRLQRPLGKTLPETLPQLAAAAGVDPAKLDAPASIAHTTIGQYEEGGGPAARASEDELKDRIAALENERAENCRQARKAQEWACATEDVWDHSAGGPSRRLGTHKRVMRNPAQCGQANLLVQMFCGRR